MYKDLEFLSQAASLGKKVGIGPCIYWIVHPQITQPKVTNTMSTKIKEIEFRIYLSHCPHFD